MRRAVAILTRNVEFASRAGVRPTRLGLRGRDDALVEYPTGYLVPTHFHDRDQLVHAERGVMTVRTQRGMWIVPPHRAVWIPAHVPHAIAMSGAVAMKTLYFKPRLARKLPRTCCVLNVSPLLRELVVYACTFGALDAKRRRDKPLLDVILDQLMIASAVPLQLPSPRDPRAQCVAQALVDEPGTEKSIEELCSAAGGSKRTIERAFVADTKLTLGKWRQQLRLLHAITLLASGESVTRAALTVGYSTPSAFVAMFRRALGVTPGEYFGLAR